MLGAAPDTAQEAGNGPVSTLFDNTASNRFSFRIVKEHGVDCHPLTLIVDAAYYFSQQSQFIIWRTCGVLTDKVWWVFEISNIASAVLKSTVYKGTTEIVQEVKVHAIIVWKTLIWNVSKVMESESLASSSTCQSSLRVRLIPIVSICCQPPQQNQSIGKLPWKWHPEISRNFKLPALTQSAGPSPRVPVGPFHNMRTLGTHTRWQLGCLCGNTKFF